MGNIGSVEQTQGDVSLDENTLRYKRLCSALKRTEQVDKVGSYFFTLWKGCLNGCTQIEHVTEQRFGYEIDRRRSWYNDAIANHNISA